MRLTVKELIARAYEVARLLREADAALMKELAARLDVTHVALSEALERSHQLECENANLRGFINTECFVKDGADYDYASTRLPLTPATSNFIAGQQAIGVEMFALMFAEEAIKDNNITTGWKARASRAASDYAERLRSEVNHDSIN